jgi:UDP-N-acetylglucosamine acyltransferase
LTGPKPEPVDPAVVSGGLARASPLPGLDGTMSMRISPHAIIDPRAELAADVEVGPFCVVGPDVRIGPGTRLLGQATVYGPTTIGRDNIIHPGCVLGGEPQDRGYKGEPTQLEIGDANILREGVTIHRGTVKGGGVTRVGNHNFLMCHVHLGHDVQFGSHCTLANSVMVAGHVHIRDHVAMGGGVGIHQFVTVGEYCFIGGLSRIHKDVPPYMRVDGADRVRGLNERALRTSGMSDADINCIEEGCRRLFYSDVPMSAVLEEYDTLNGINPHLKQLVEFMRRRLAGKYGRYLESLRHG